MLNRLIQYRSIIIKPDVANVVRHLSAIVRHSWKERPTLVIGSAICAIVSLAAVLAPWLSPYDPIKQNLEATLLPPSTTHIMGTDDLGRDIFSRVLYGARISLMVGIGATGLGLVVGTVLGLLSGYGGGLMDTILMRIMDSLLSMPGLLLAIGIAGALGPGLNNVIIALSIMFIPAFARLVRGQVLSIREQEFIKAAKVVGARTWHIVLRHVLPNCLTPIIVLGSLRIATAILAEAGLSFLGMGAKPPTPSWGSMVSLGKPYLETHPWVIFMPGSIIFITILGLSLMGEGIRDALDPRLRSR